MVNKCATPQPPEWKGEPEQLIFVRAPERDLFVSDLITETINWYGTAGATDGDALSDFTARRKAKREVSAAALPDPPCQYCGMLADAHREDCNRPDPPPWRYYPRDCSDLSRAMSTPLPQDPPSLIGESAW